jgi:hypothetical protein
VDVDKVSLPASEPRCTLRLIEGPTKGGAAGDPFDDKNLVPPPRYQLK